MLIVILVQGTVLLHARLIGSSRVLDPWMSTNFTPLFVQLNSTNKKKGKKNRIIHKILFPPKFHQIKDIPLCMICFLVVVDLYSSDLRSRSDEKEGKPWEDL